MTRFGHFELSCDVDGCHWRVHVSSESIASKAFENLLIEHGEREGHYPMKLHGTAMHIETGEERLLAIYPDNNSDRGLK